MVTSLKISEELKEELNNYRYEKEAYHVVIKRILEENKKLKEEVEYLEEDKKQLYKLVLKTSDSAALVNNIHKATYFISLVINDISLTEEEKLQQLEIYLSEMLEDNIEDVITTVENLKEMLELDKVEVPKVLLTFEENLHKWK